MIQRRQQNNGGQKRHRAGDGEIADELERLRDARLCPALISRVVFGILRRHCGDPPGVRTVRPATVASPTGIGCLSGAGE